MVKMAMGLACSISLVLLLVILATENPERALFERTVEELMAREGLNTFNEVIKSFPILKSIEADINRMGHLNRMIQSNAGGPAPVITKAKSLEMQECNQEIRQLRERVTRELLQLLAAQAKRSL